MNPPQQTRRSAAIITPTPLDDICTAGRNARTKGGYEKGMFRDVKSVNNLAHALGVPSAAIACVEIIPEKKCVSPGCQFNAAKGNHSRCPAHQRSWYPLSTERGCDLLGSDFMSFANQKYRTCCCSQTFCSAAGYFPKQGALFVPKAGRDTVLSTPNLFSSAQRQKLADKPIYLYPWHFFPEHLKKNVKDGAWELDFAKKVDRKYHDLEGRWYAFPPPRNTARSFLDAVYFDEHTRPQDRWRDYKSEFDLPAWATEMIALDVGEVEVASSPTEPETQVRRSERFAPPPNIPTLEQISAPPEALCPRVEVDWKARAQELQARLDGMFDWKARALQLDSDLKRVEREGEQRLSGAKRRYDNSIAKTKQELDEARKKIAELEERVRQLNQKIVELRALLTELRQQKGRPLRYDDLYPGGILNKHVDAFTFFPTVEMNDAFLELLNYADGSPGSFPKGDGLLENLRPYGKVKMEERRGEVEAPSLNDEEYAKYLARRNNARKDEGMTFKDDYLAFCLYVRAGCTNKFVESIMGSCLGRISDIYHEWCVVLDDGLSEMFPRPTRSQMLRAFPQRTIEADGHARNFVLLDAVEIFAQKSSNNNVASSTHSNYKKHTTVKFLAACCPIGSVWSKLVPDGNPGKLSDGTATEDTKILRQVPFGHTAKTDKGFLVDNEAAHEGVTNDRPSKRQKRQVQQSVAETGNTQNKGNTRITVENVNGGVKNQLRYLLDLVKCNQFDTVSKVVRIGYLMQNFKKAIIQNHNYSC